MTLTMKNPVSTIAVQTTAETKHNFYKRCADMNITASTAIRRIVEGIVKDPSILDDFGIHKPEGIHIVKGERDMKDMDGADEIDVLRYEAFRAYSNMFLKKQYKAIGIKFDLDEDEDVLDILNQHQEKKKFVCDLIREDMKKHGR